MNSYQRDVAYSQNVNLNNPRLKEKYKEEYIEEMNFKYFE